jgi:hypothetical protein
MLEPSDQERHSKISAADQIDEDLSEDTTDGGMRPKTRHWAKTRKANEDNVLHEIRPFTVRTPV